MQLKLMYHGEKAKCEQVRNDCESTMCSRELMLKVMQSLVRPQIMPVIHRIFEIQELFQLADLICLGENQLYHVIRMCEHAAQLKDGFLANLRVKREDLTTAILFHDCGKGREIDDKTYSSANCKRAKVPRNLKAYGIPDWAEFYSPLHDHVGRSLRIAETYNIKGEVREAIALHHHVKILPEVLKQMARGLYLPGVICEDILHHKPQQYAAKGSILSQTIAVLDQLSAIERKFEGKVYVAGEPEKIEEDLVKDLVIGVTDANDPRVNLLGNSLEGSQTVIMFDLRAFGVFVQQNSEYKVQAVKREVLNTIRSVIRVQDHHREQDMVGLVGGDEFAVITKVKGQEIIEKMIERIKSAIKNRTGLNVRYGYNAEGSIEKNFHEAREKANLQK